MPFFPFIHSRLSRLSRATPLPQGGWGLPDDVPLTILLDLTPMQVGRIGFLSVKHLRLSGHRSETLADRKIATISLLLDCTIAVLLRVPTLGHGSVTEILDRLLFLAGSEDIPAENSPNAPAVLPPLLPIRRVSSFVPLAPDEREPLTLRHEWELFSGLPSCEASLPLPEIISDETRCCLQEVGIIRLRDLFDQPIAALCECFGDETSEEVLNALTTYAAEVRLLPNPRVVFEPVQGQESVLTRRWGHRPISELNLANEAIRALRRAHVSTVAEMLVVLEPLHIELALDPFAFSLLWMTLQKVGLRQEAWEDAGERLSAEAYTRASLDHVISAWCGFISPVHWNVVSSRLVLEKSRIGDTVSGRMPTLEEVANQYGVTRERVRQIELRFIERLTKKNDDYFVALQNALQMILFQAGGVISLEQAAEELAEWINPGEAAPEGFCRLILNNSPSFVPIKKNAIYALTSQPYRFYQTTINTAREIVTTSHSEKSIIDLTEAIVEQLFLSTGNPEADEKLPSREFVAACLVATGDFESGFSAPTEVALVRLLREMGSPRHFTELTDRLNEKGWREKSFSEKYVHNHLIYRRDLFVHVSAGTYGLVEWGLEDQRNGRRIGGDIAELVAEFLDARGIPVSKEEIVAYVLTRKNCRDYSVLQRLSTDGRFHRFDKNKYGLSKWTF